MDNVSKQITLQFLTQLQEQFLLSLFELVIQQGSFDELTKLKLFLKNVSSTEQLNNFVDNLSKLQKLQVLHIIFDNQKVRINYFMNSEEKKISEFHKQVIQQYDNCWNKMIDCILSKQHLKQLILDFRNPNIYINDLSFENWPVYFENVVNLTHLQLYFDCNYKKQNIDQEYLTVKSLKLLNQSIQKCRNTLQHILVSFQGYYFDLKHIDSQEYKVIDSECKSFFVDKLNYPNLSHLQLKIPFSSEISPYKMSKEISQEYASKLVSLIIDSNWIDKQFMAIILLKFQLLNNIQLTLENLSQQEYKQIFNSIKAMQNIVRVQITTTFSFQLDIYSIFHYFQTLISSKYLSNFKIQDKSSNRIILSEKVILQKKKLIYLIKSIKFIQLSQKQTEDLFSEFLLQKPLFAESMWLKIAMLTHKIAKNSQKYQFNQECINSQQQIQLLKIIKQNEKQISINWKYNKVQN
ncbi:hypothetical protein ABPG72_006672 [Tetrahymena utriculariae]